MAIDKQNSIPTDFITNFHLKKMLFLNASYGMFSEEEKSESTYVLLVFLR